MRFGSLKPRIQAIWFLVSFFSFAILLDDFEYHENPSIVYTYNRTDELEKHCRSILSSASELEPDDNRGRMIKKEMFFQNGDWDQEPASGSPLMPFKDAGNNYFGRGPPMKQVSFWVADVNPVRQVKDAVSISAVMNIGISSNSSEPRTPYESPRFYQNEGISEMIILFQGLYIESNENGGQQSMCLLGNAMMPTLNQYDYNSNQRSALVAEDQILLVLHYPKTFSLTRRAILGEMRSLNQKWNLTYFNKVHISSSEYSYSLRYEFDSGGLLASACSPYPYQDKLVNGRDKKMFKGDEYCKKLKDLITSEPFSLIPNLKYSGSEIGSLLLGRQIEESDSIFEKYKLMMKDVRCEPGDEQNGIKSTKVSAIFKVIEAHEYMFREEIKTGLSGATFSAEGTIHSSHGQLCMVGCKGLLDSPAKRCALRICLYLPLMLSITQRSMAFGTISSINESFSVLFEKDSTVKKFLDKYEWNRNMDMDWLYNYTKTIQASEFRMRNNPSKLTTLLRKYFLNYPSFKGNHVANYSLLSDILSVKVCSIPLTFPNSRTSRIYAEIDVLSLGSFFGRYWSRKSQDVRFQEQVYSSTDTIKISGQIIITGREFFNISLFLEGLYDPVVGEMYLIGCRDVRALTTKLSYNGSNLEGGMDCEIEVKVIYPPKNARWLLNPKVRIFINSKRTKNDPLYFGNINMRTFLLSYKKKVDDVLFRQQFEKILCILLLLVAILSTFSQMCYTEKVRHGTSPAYVSIVMLSIHALSYSIPLITGDEEVIFKRKEFSNQSQENFQLWEVLDSFIKTLLMIALMMTLKLSQKVWESRREQPGHSREKPVILVSLVIHALGFIIFWACSKYTSQTSGNLVKQLGFYWGIVQDLFLIPQIVGIVVWRVKGKVKPLRRLYYLGFTSIRLVIHVYEYLRDPIPSPQQDDYVLEYMGGLEFYAKLGQAIIAVISILLAVIVYFQQRSFTKSQQRSSEVGVYQKLL